jgi:hypothetical protein
MTPQSNILIGSAGWLRKLAPIFVIGLVAGGLLIAAGRCAWNWWSYDRPRGQIAVFAINGPSQPPPSHPTFKQLKDFCVDKELPIFVVFFNESRRTIEYIDIEVNAHLPGRSANILTYAQTSLDQIVEPKSGWGQCYTFGVSDQYKNDPDVANALYSAKVNFVRFKED